MTSGKPLTDREKRVIKEQHEIGAFPAVIARHLANKYPEENGGYRDAETVRRYIKQLDNPIRKAGRKVKEKID